MNSRASISSDDRKWYDVGIERGTVSRYKKPEWHDLFSRILVATGVPSQREAEDLAARLRRELHLPEGA